MDRALTPFRTAAGCPAEPELTTDAVATVATWRCADGFTITRVVIAGGGHVWFGLGERAGTQSDPMDVTGFLWNRLRAARSQRR